MKKFKESFIEKHPYISAWLVSGLIIGISMAGLANNIYVAPLIFGLFMAIATLAAGEAKSIE